MWAWSKRLERVATEPKSPQAVLQAPSQKPSKPVLTKTHSAYRASHRLLREPKKGLEIPIQRWSRVHVCWKLSNLVPSDLHTKCWRQLTGGYKVQNRAPEIILAGEGRSQRDREVNHSDVRRAIHTKFWGCGHTIPKGAQKGSRWGREPPSGRPSQAETKQEGMHRWGNQNRPEERIRTAGEESGSKLTPIRSPRPQTLL